MVRCPARNGENIDYHSFLPVPDENEWEALRLTEKIAYESVLNTGAPLAWAGWSWATQQLEEATWAYEDSITRTWRCWIMTPRELRLSSL